MPFTSPSRRALGLFAVSTVGLSSAVLGLTVGVAQAAVPTYSVSGTGTTAAVPAGICAVEWTVDGGGGGADSDGTYGDPGGEAYVTLPVSAGDTFSLFEGAAGTDAADASTFGTGGTNGQSSTPANQGQDGAVNNGVAGGGGGAASVVMKGGSVLVLAFGGTGAGGAAGGGGTANTAAGAPADFDTAATGHLGDGAITGDGIPCQPRTPYLNSADSADGALVLDFVDQTKAGDVPAVSYEYTKDGGTTWTALTTSTRDGRIYATVSGLTNGTAYTVAVRAVGGANTIPSDPSQPVQGTPFKAAGAPTGVVVGTGPAALTVTWNASTPGDHPVAKYVAEMVVSYGQSGDVTPLCEVPAGTLTCTGPAQPGMTHVVVVHAVDSAGNWSAMSSSVTSGVVPFTAAPPTRNGDLSRPAGQSGSVPAGKTMTVSGTGYAPNSSVTVLIYSSPQVLTTVVADGSGDFTATVTVPAGLEPGQHTLVASGVDSSGAMRYVTLPVTVTGGTTGAGGLAYTGANIALPALGGLAAVVAGAALLFFSRRRTAG